MLFEILGPLRCAGARLDKGLSRRREGRILAALLLFSGHAVSLHRLVDMLWAQHPPATARQQVQNCVASLARLLRDSGVELPISHTRCGYQISVPTEDLDASLFENEIAAANQLAGAQEWPAAAAMLRSAIGRWRGAVLDGIDLGPFGPAAARLEEIRLEAVEHLFALDLSLGRHEEVLPDMVQAVGAHPDRERLVGQYMIALARTGRAAQALAVFRQTRRLLREEHGIEPGAELRAIHLSILRDGHAPADVRLVRPTLVDQQQRLLQAVAAAEAARQQLELALREARSLTAGLPAAPGG